MRFKCDRALLDEAIGDRDSSYGVLVRSAKDEKDKNDESSRVVGSRYLCASKTSMANTDLFSRTIVKGECLANNNGGSGLSGGWGR